MNVDVRIGKYAARRMHEKKKKKVGSMGPHGIYARPRHTLSVVFVFTCLTIVSARDLSNYMSQTRTPESTVRYAKKREILKIRKRR